MSGTRMKTRASPIQPSLHAHVLSDPASAQMPVFLAHNSGPGMALGITLP